jgi:hypothetical protein
MSIVRWLVPIAMAIAAAIFIVVIYVPTNDKCSAANLILEDPLTALTSVDPGLPTAEAQEAELRESNAIVDYIRGPCNRDNWWGPVTVWLLIWGPMCATLIGAGYVSARHGGSWPMLKSVIAGVGAVGLVLGTYLLVERSYAGLVPTTSIFCAIGLVCASGVVSSIGGLIGRRHA